MFEIRRYSADMKSTWDCYVLGARNATFLFLRDYMDYHADRFNDHSLLFYKKGKLKALLPGHTSESTYFSHNGLTYGGLIVNMKVCQEEVLTLFSELNAYLRCQGVTRVVYRPVPWLYHTVVAEEDLYAIFHVCNAQLAARSVGTAVYMDKRLRWREGHRQSLAAAQKAGVTVVKDAPLEEFWPLLEEKLRTKHNASPVHSLEEIKLLKSRFPENIIQYNAYIDEKIVGGQTVYLTPQVLRSQYCATNDDGNAHGAMQAIYDRVMRHDFPSHRYYDFGGATEDQGRRLNTGLMSHKEGYAGRAICYDTYSWTIE